MPLFAGPLVTNARSSKFGLANTVPAVSTAIAWVSTARRNYFNGAFTVTKPTLTGTDLIMVMHATVFSATAPAMSLPSGWVETYPAKKNSVDQWAVSAYKVVGTGSSESAATEYTFSASNYSMEANIEVFSGVNQTSPLDVVSTTNTGTTTTATALSVTTGTAGSMLLFDYHTYNSWASDTASPPSGFTWSHAPAGEGYYRTAYGIQSAAGASGNKTVTVGASPWIANLVALRSSVVSTYMFPSASLTPNTTRNVDSPTNLGLFLKVTTNKTITVTAVRLFLTATSAMTVAPRLYDSVGSTLNSGGATSVPAAPGTWATIPLAVPIVIPASTFYFGVYMSGGVTEYGAAAAAFGSVVSNADLSIATGAQSRYLYGADGFSLIDDANKGNSTAWYNVDLVYTR